MNKVRTTINLNKDVVDKAKELGINISAAAERGIIEYIKELEAIRGECKDNDNGNLGNSHEPIIRRGGDLNSRSPEGEPALKAGAVGRTLLPRLDQTRMEI